MRSYVLQPQVRCGAAAPHVSLFHGAHEDRVPCLTGVTAQVMRWFPRRQQNPSHNRVSNLKHMPEAHRAKPHMHMAALPADVESYNSSMRSSACLSRLALDLSCGTAWGLTSSAQTDPPWSPGRRRTMPSSMWALQRRARWPAKPNVRVMLQPSTSHLTVFNSTCDRVCERMPSAWQLPDSHQNTPSTSTGRAGSHGVAVSVTST